MLNVPSSDRNDNYDDPGMFQFFLGRLIRQLSIVEFSAALGLYMDEFKEENNLHVLSRHIHFSPSKCWHTLAPRTASYSPSRSKASVLPPSLRYLHAILAHTIIEMRESTSVHQMERHWKGVISIGPYVTRLAQHFGLLNTVAQESSLTLIGQTSPQGISSMLSMRMIERHRGTYPPQYRLAKSTKEEAYEGIPDDVPHSTRTHRLNHHHPLVQFMRRSFSISTSHRQSYLANHPAMKEL
ncbi:hypothetical protein GOBAR_AA11729 [Gossypium barbadense]|uniref:Uncharacterized protein n=1 Tax=Gossypium barbadense TaxID=3634 RepID=A0A2P5XZZ8_GOSBA|nr:hypothetical protein GOBAR_AA11729 [Gossypium barbadense]